ncbi:MAG: hypothetical protein RR630_10210 [Coprobacillus sp.]
MKKERILTICCALLFLLSLSSKQVNAVEMSTMYVNSEEVKQEWDGLKNAIGFEATLIDDDHYEQGKPGEYIIKYKDVDNIQKSLKLVVVQSEGTIKNISPCGSNVFEVEKSFFDGDVTQKLNSLVIDKEKVVLTIEKEDGATLKVITGLTNDLSGAGGGPLDDGSEIYSTSYCPIGGFRGRHEARNIEQVKYYNPIDSETGDNEYIVYYALYSTNKTNQNITTKDENIRIETTIPSISGKIIVNSNDLSIDDKTKGALKASRYKAISLSLTDDLNNIYQVSEKTKVSYKLDNKYDKNNIVVYQLKDEKITQLDNKVEGEYVVFEAPTLPGQYIIAEKSKEEIVTPPTSNADTTKKDSVKEEVKKSDTVKTSDISWGVYAILMIISFGYVVTLRVKIKK